MRRFLRSHSTARLGIVLLRTCDPCFYVSLGFCSACRKVPRGFEPRSLDSESRVLAVTPQDQLSSTRSSFPSLLGRCTRLFLCCASCLVCLTSLPPTLAVVSLLSTSYHRGYGATVARLTPDQKVGSSNLSGLILHDPSLPICLLTLFPSSSSRRVYFAGLAAAFFAFLLCLLLWQPLSSGR